jgi:hypothetical protein
MLQVAVAILGLVPVLAGLAGILWGPAMIQSLPFADISLDSHYRYLSGLLFGIGLVFWSCIPKIEVQTARFRILTLIVFIGGLARLYALAYIGMPDRHMLIGLAMELVITPSLAYWQSRVSCYKDATTCHTF